MKILAIDASSVSCATCVADNDVIISSSYMRNGLTHSATLLPSVEKVLSDAKCEMKDVERVCVTVGPGSFTGVKIAAATAKGLCFANNITAVSVSTLSALAYNAEVSDGLICPVMDARRGMMYNALFRAENGKITRLCPDRQISAEEIAEAIKNENATIVGDGAGLFAALCADKDINVKTLDEAHTYIQAGSVVKAYLNGDGREVNADMLTPEYLRPPQAERERAEKLKKEKNI